MKPLPAACLLLLLAHSSLAEPPHDAITQYRAFTTAIRAGKVEEAAKFVEPVPKEAAPLLTASLKVHVLSDALKRELTAQLGPPPPGDPDEFGETTRITDQVLQSLKVEPKNDKLVMLRGKLPRPDKEVTLGWMINRDGRWLVPAALLIGLEFEPEPEPTFKLPAEDVRQHGLRHMQDSAKAIEVLLERLKKKEFKTRAEVFKAVADLLPPADGEIDVDEC